MKTFNIIIRQGNTNQNHNDKPHTATRKVIINRTRQGKKILNKLKKKKKRQDSSVPLCMSIDPNSWKDESGESLEPSRTIPVRIIFK
jgi:hypothetical protein